MYQFPDSSEVMGQAETVPIKKRSRYKIIIIANILVALFIIAIVWFFFFFDAKPNNSQNTADTAHATGDFTPIINDENSSEINHLPVKSVVISTITETGKDNTEVQKLSTDDAITHELITVNNNKTIKPLDAQKETTNKPLSAVDRIAYELMKGKTTPTEIVQPEQPEQLKKAPLPPLNSNQVIRKATTEPSLTKLIDQAEKNLNTADQKLISTIKTVDNPSRGEKNITADNSIEFKKTSDIDKIMAAMGGVKKPPEIKAIERIDTTVKKLLNSDAIKLKQADSYVKNLQSETEENRKERRTIMVKEGEKLWDLAVRAYGDGNKYKIILQANPFLKNNPNLIKAGITLRAPVIDYSDKSK